MADQSASLTLGCVTFSTRFALSQREHRLWEALANGPVRRWLCSDRTVADPASGSDALALAASRMLGKPDLEGRTISLLVAQRYDLPEFELTFGAQAARAAVAAATVLLAELAERKGVVLRTAPDTLVLLVREHELAEAAKRNLTRSFTIEFSFEGEEIVLVPDVMFASLRESEGADSVYRGLCSDIERARSREERRKEYLRRERESHTRPSHLALSTSQPARYFPSQWQQTTSA